ncbi:hypothetical protein D3C73_1095060 [compost metagenome]
MVPFSIDIDDTVHLPAQPDPANFTFLQHELLHNLRNSPADYLRVLHPLPSTPPGQVTAVVFSDGVQHGTAVQIIDQPGQGGCPDIQSDKLHLLTSSLLKSMICILLYRTY